MKSYMILLAVTALLSMTRCNQPQPPRQNKLAVPKTMPDLKHKQDIIFRKNSTTATLYDLPVGLSYVERIRKEDKDSLHKYFPLQNARSGDHIKISLRDRVTGEEVILAEK